MTEGQAPPATALVTPTRRLAHHLKARFDADCIARGLTVWRRPDILTWSGLVERMASADRQAGRSTARWLGDASARLAWERLVQADPQSSGVIATEGLGRVAHRSWRLLHDYAIPRDALAEAGGPEAAAFARWVREFSAWLQQGEWLDAAVAPQWVDPRSAGSALRFVGFDVLTPAQQAFVTRLRAAGVPVEIDPPPTAAGRTGWIAARDRDTEIDLAARWAAARLHGVRGQRLAIVVPDLGRQRARVRRALDRVLAPQATVGGGPAPESTAYELAAARPLGARPVVAAALEWLGAFGRDGSLATCSALLRNPFGRGAETEAHARATLDAWLRRHESPDLGLATLATHAAGRRCPELAGLLQAGLAEVARWPRRQLPSAWSRHFSQLLLAIGWPGAGLDSGAHQAWQRWQALLGEFAAHDDVAGPLTPRAALAMLRELAEATLFEPEEIRAPLLVIDPATCAGMTFDAIWVCGLDAGGWPPPAAPDPFLPRALQATRGVPGATAELAEAEARRTLERLRGSAPEVILSVPMFEDETPLLPSSLLAGIERLSPPELWSTHHHARAIFAARPELPVSMDGAMPELAAGERASGGAKVLELQAACPFRASAELRLGARPLEEPALGLDAAARGELVHEVFARLWRETGSRQAMQARPDAERRALVQAVIAGELAPLRRRANPVLARLLDIEASWLETHALELLEHDLARPDFTIEEIETDHSVETGGLHLRLRVDRVDRLSDGSLAVIDYKTGSQAEPKSWLDERPKLPQLPLYAEALGSQRVSAVAFGRVRAGQTGYAGLARDAGLFPGCGRPPKAYASWEALLAQWHRRIEALAREFASGDARLAPNPSQACRYCHLPALCRIGEAGIAGGDGEPGDE